MRTWSATRSRCRSRSRRCRAPIPRPPWRRPPVPGSRGLKGDAGPVSLAPMDSMIAASARALAAGDALGALKRVALRDDARAFGTHEALARARCIVAGAEVALAMRDFAGSPRELAAAAATLETHAD